MNTRFHMRTIMYYN